ncbi:hypothetical protein APR50_33840 [Variovorax paradoxus]|uniref:hypothetical protein n=1 Tax=Comamonadaceae TaxID=80864 RepID=UPI00056DE566|nr:hypothetical protein [Xenophilus azovorans]KPU89193.1 hypothetical protein APR52_39415 [Variovorax paradoxus]KPU89267.1 hypothetical protein APR49_42605 [Variovorax paradoxus]KPU98770.1 hypothetical protein APR50_33840 [Variovorax paradoxus]KPV07002.1 hypothetical protein APR51_43575 [Variovorax paradoxus]KPV26395.1 hypothetical protein APR48_31365 [Variovorax paradoxus]
MNVKILAYGLQQDLRQAAGLSVNRSHIYELIAAALGAGSYAALVVEGLVLKLPTHMAAQRSLDVEGIVARARALNQAPLAAGAIAKAVRSGLEQASVGLVPLDLMLERLLDERYELFEDDLMVRAVGEKHDDLDELDEEGWRERWQAQEEALDLSATEVREALGAAAERGDGRAHLALALLEGMVLLEDIEGGNSGADGRYWYERQQKGEVFTGVEKEWADGYASRRSGRQSAEQHLAAAADLGQHDALLLLAARTGDARFFDLPDPQVHADPYEVATLADRMGQHDAALMWLEAAAMAGDLQAMRELIEDRQTGDPLKCWTWFHLAKLHGKDLTLDDYHAVHEDGSAYDDDVGGNMFAVGEDGVELPSASEELQAQARRLAKSIYERYSTA